MQPNQENNVPNRPVVTRRPINANARPAGSAAARAPENAGPTFDNGPSVVGSKGGRKTGWILTTILLFLIAAGGVGFGVWAYMDGNTQKDQLNSQISTLQQQNAELQSKLDGNGTISVSGGSADSDVNPVIEAGDGFVYRVHYESPKYSINVDDFKTINIGVEDGKVTYCGINFSGNRETEACEISGLSGDIYNIVDFTPPAQEASSLNIGFIMTDGSVEYLSFMDAMENNNFNVKKLNIDGSVVNAITVGHGSSDPNVVGSGVVTVFVMNDGTLVELDGSMLE